jgi:hypothetical protein
MNAQSLHEKAELCLRLARLATTCDARHKLWTIAMRYETDARQLDAKLKSLRKSTTLNR